MRTDIENSGMRIISDFARSGHPLGVGIDWEDVEALCKALIARLGSSLEVLSLKATSLNRLEEMLYTYYDHRTAAEGEFSKEETAIIIREIAAYWGAVCMIHTDGKWENLGSLASTYITYDGYYKNRPHTTSFSPANTAAVLWGTIAGFGRVKENFLYRQYASVKQRDTRIIRQANEATKGKKRSLKELFLYTFVAIFIVVFLLLFGLGFLMLFNLDAVIWHLEHF